MQRLIVRCTRELISARTRKTRVTIVMRCASATSWGGLIVRLFLTITAMLAGCALLAVSAHAQSVSPKDIDLSCAITSEAEMGANPKGSAEQSAALMVFTFYLGRLTARDEKTHWNDVIKGSVAELREKARLENVYASCMNFYLSQIK